MQLQESANIELTASPAINELHFGNDVNAAVEQNHRADFSLLLAMFSDDVRETAPIDDLNPENTPEMLLREQLNVPEPRQLVSDHDSYNYAAEIARQFHNGGLKSAQLQADLCPDALAYTAQNSHGLGEEVYRNLSFHSKRGLTTKKPSTLKPTHLYQDLVVASRTNQIRQSIV